MRILQLTILILVTILLIPTNASAHCKGKHQGDHPHCSGDDGGSGEYSGSDGVEFIPDGAAGFDYHIVGTSGSDNITAGGGTDLIQGGNGDDGIQALGANDEIHGGDGGDTIDAGEGDDSIYGDAGDDLLMGGPGNDRIEGGDGNDELYFSLGADYLDGNQGYDTLVFADYIGPGGYAQVNHVTVDMDLNTFEANVTDLSGATFTVSGNFLGIEDLEATRGDDVLMGSDTTDNYIHGAEGDDVIHGRGGNDILNGGQGNDDVYGGPGDDWVEGHPGADLVVGGPGNDTVSGQERGYGNSMDDELWGGDNITLVDGEADTFHFHGTFGTDTVMDYQQDETIHITGFVSGSRNDLNFSKLNINPDGEDIVISFWVTRGGGSGGTIILKGADARGITVDESDIVID